MFRVRVLWRALSAGSEMRRGMTVLLLRLRKKMVSANQSVYQDNIYGCDNWSGSVREQYVTGSEDEMRQCGSKFQNK